MKVEYYKSNLGVFLKNPIGHYYNKPYLDCFKVNGKTLEKPLVNGYVLVEGVEEIVFMERWQDSAKVLVGFSPKKNIPDAISQALPQFYSVEQAGCYYNDDDEDCFKNAELEAMKHLYEAVFETQEGYWKEVEVEKVCLGDIVVENYNAPEKMLVKVEQDTYKYIAPAVDLSTIVSYSDLEKMLTPEFLLHKRPCSLSSVQVYKIVRQYVKQHINYDVATITSDYDFCFTVKKRVKIKPIHKRTEIKKQNGRSYATPKYKETTETHRLIQVFEMTNAKDRYNGYTVIDGFNADSLEDMQTQVKVYLETLMETINSPLKECPHCNGVGIVSCETFE